MTERRRRFKEDKTSQNFSCFFKRLQVRVQKEASRPDSKKEGGEGSQDPFVKRNKTGNYEKRIETESKCKKSISMQEENNNKRKGGGGQETGKEMMLVMGRRSRDFQEGCKRRKRERSSGGDERYK